VSTTDTQVSTMLHLRVSTACAEQLRALALERGTSVNAEARAILEAPVTGQAEASAAESAPVRPVDALAAPESPLLPPELLEAVQRAATRRASGIQPTPQAAIRWALEFALQEDARALRRLAKLRSA
jgi:plasmid stability protein